MKRSLVIVLIILASVVFMTSNAFAQLQGPYVSIAGGTFDYDDVSNELSITMGVIGSVRYIDNSMPFFNGPGPAGDYMLGGTWTISGLFNGDGAGENWDFIPDSNNGAVFTLYDDPGMTSRRLTAEIWDFEVVKNGSLFEVNAGFDTHNVKNFVFDPNTPESRFITEADSFHAQTWEPMGNLYMSFNFTGDGTNDFKESQSGTVSGTFSVVPEPMSSSLFILGSAIFMIRHFRKRKIRTS